MFRYSWNELTHLYYYVHIRWYAGCCQMLTAGPHTGFWRVLGQAWRFDTETGVRSAGAVIFLDTGKRSMMDLQKTMTELLPA